MTSGSQILDLLSGLDLPIKEGTLYPLLNRMTTDGMLSSVWETDKSVHPRKFYSLTKTGRQAVQDMQTEFGKLARVYEKLTKMEAK